MDYDLMYMHNLIKVKRNDRRLDMFLHLLESEWIQWHVTVGIGPCSR